MPYAEGVTVVVVKKGHVASFTESNGQQGQLLNFSVADKSGAILATLNDKTKHARIVEGKTLLIRKFILKGGKLALSHKTTTMGKPAMDIPSSVIENATYLILPPSPEKKVSDAQTAP